MLEPDETSYSDPRRPEQRVAAFLLVFGVELSVRERAWSRSDEIGLGLPVAAALG